MLKQTLLAVAITALVLPVYAVDAQQANEQTKTQAKEQVYGSQLMTQEERSAYRMKMRSAKNQDEREQIRLEHHKQMQERAKEKGVTLPEDPPARGGGMGPGGGGMGPGMRR